MNRCKLQIFFIVLELFNRIYTMVPSFAFRRLMIAASGSSIASSSCIHRGVRFFGFGRVKVGEHTTINRGCYLDNRGSITIGNNVSIAHDCKIYTAGHDYNDPSFSIVTRDVVVEDYVCLFANVLVMPGVTIGKGAVVFPGSVVTKSVEPFTVAGGNPAAFIKKRSRKLSYTIDYCYHCAL
jgi:maltose O-acetyltransferase